jgi:RNA ligase (TIGR02306 family)
MSTFAVPVVRIEKLEKHPNADALSITEVEGCPVVCRTGDYQVGDLAIYVPIEAVVPLDRPGFDFLRTKENQTTVRIKAKKLRGIFSMGLLVPIDILKDNSKFAELSVGDDVSELLGIKKYVEPIEHIKLGGNRMRRPPDSTICPVYDIESHRKYKGVFQAGEQVVVTEKIHGCNGRFTFHQRDEDVEPRLCVSSRQFFLVESDDNVWWLAARKYDLTTKLAKIPNLVLYGEVYGVVQDLKYGATKDDPIHFRAFDLYDKERRRFLDYADFKRITEELGIPTVPVLYEGPYDPSVIEPLALGNSTIAHHIKEGVVIKPVVERWDDKLGRVITKLVGEQYLLRKDGTEFQ